MKACVQRVSSASVKVAGQIHGQIGQGLVVLLGVAPDDTVVDSEYLAGKISGLRIFNDAEGKMNRSLGDIAGAMLVISQFTLLGDCRKGRRPSFVAAAEPELAERLYENFIAQLTEKGVAVETGKFGAHMEVALVNDGPVTMLLDSIKPA